MPRLLLYLFCLVTSLATAADQPLVAVASNLTQALTEIADQYQASSGIKVKLSFGSSGNFSRQILQGAPYQVFISADQSNVDFLIANGKKPLRNQAFAQGQIGFFIPAGSQLSGITDLNGIIEAIEFGNYNRLAIANPEVAPYGLAAEQALASAGVWIINRHKLLIGENIAQTVQFCLAGGIDIGIVPTSAAIQPEVRGHGNFIPIPPDWYQPIQQFLVLLTDSNPSATRFFNYLMDKESQAVLIKYGYTPNAQK